jgi:hypothetical protein
MIFNTTIHALASSLRGSRFSREIINLASSVESNDRAEFALHALIVITPRLGETRYCGVFDRDNRYLRKYGHVNSRRLRRLRGEKPPKGTRIIKAFLFVITLFQTD